MPYDGLTSEYPHNFVLPNIGLDVPTFDGRLLDIGCGKHAYLVRRLRTFGISAEGIDPELPEDTSFLMRQNASYIPRPDGYYDLAASHNAHFKDGLELNQAAAIRLVGQAQADFQYLTRCKEPMVRTIYEALRVLKRGKRFIIWPTPRYLLAELREELLNKGVQISEERIEGNVGSFEDALTRMPFHVQQHMSGIPKDELDYRAVLTKAA